VIRWLRLHIHQPHDAAFGKCFACRKPWPCKTYRRSVNGRDTLTAQRRRYETIAEELDYYASKTDGGTWADGAREAAQRIREVHRG
jgi:hypothetical protein